MVTVVNSAGEIAELTTGNKVERPEIEADNAKQRAPVKAAEVKTEIETKAPDNAADDVEGEDGLTPRQKREFSAAMLRSIGKKHREKQEAEEFAASQYNERRLAEQRAENAERQLAELQAKPAVKAPEPAQKPERKDFQNDDAYQDALVDFRVKETLARDRQEAAERQEQERQQAITTAANERLARAAELVPDFEKVVEQGDMRVPGHIAGYMRESELFAELGYHLAQHPEVLDQLAKLSPAKALVEVGKIESKLTPFAPSPAAGAGEKVNASQASASETESASSKTAATGKGADPSRETESATSRSAGPSQHRAPVITPLSTSSASQVEKAPQEMNIREHITDYQKRKKVDLGRRQRH